MSRPPIPPVRCTCGGTLYAEHFSPLLPVEPTDELGCLHCSHVWATWRPGQDGWQRYVAAPPAVPLPDPKPRRRRPRKTPVLLRRSPVRARAA